MFSCITFLAHNVAVHLWHLVLPGELGDTHILLKVLSDEKSTGIIDDDQKARTLIKLILENTEELGFFIEVFPEGRDPDRGEWEKCVFEHSDFIRAVKAVSNECNWDISKPLNAKVRTVTPGVPY